ncbi:MAG: hypothetical protein U0V70_03445 [Terriglobia bacterium]
MLHVMDASGSRTRRSPQVQSRQFLLRFTNSLLSLIVTFALLPWPALAASGAESTTSTTPSLKKRKVTRVSSKRHSRLKVGRARKPMPPLSEAPFATEVALLPIIEEAKSRLEKETVRYIPGAKKNDARREIKLAVANFKTGEIQIIPAEEKSNQLNILDPAIKAKVDWWNGFNSSISILDPPNSGVVAMLYGLEPKRQRTLEQDAIIYTPYSSALLQSELVMAGISYLMGKISQARMELANVSSRAFPGTTLGDASGLTDKDYFNLILTEQMDPGRFRSIAAGTWEFDQEQESQFMRLAERILVIIGANQEDAYRFTGNYASARGLTQFTPTGMKVVWKSYPEANIPRDFMEATGDHGNSIKAEICLLDHDLADLSRSFPPLIGSGKEIYAAGAAYNGGPKRVRYGLENFGIDWFHPLSRLEELESRNPQSRLERKEYLWLKKYRSHETFVYLNKLYAIQQSHEKLCAKRESPPPQSDAP